MRIMFFSSVNLKKEFYTLPSIKFCVLVWSIFLKKYEIAESDIDETVSKSRLKCCVSFHQSGVYYTTYILNPMPLTPIIYPIWCPSNYLYIFNLTSLTWCLLYYLYIQSDVPYANYIFNLGLSHSLYNHSDVP